MVAKFDCQKKDKVFLIVYALLLMLWLPIKKKKKEK